MDQACLSCSHALKVRYMCLGWATCAFSGKAVDLYTCCEHFEPLPVAENLTNEIVSRRIVKRPGPYVIPGLCATGGSQLVKTLPRTLSNGLDK